MRKIYKKFIVLALVVFVAVTMGLFMQYSYSRNLVNQNAEAYAKVSISILNEQIQGWLLQQAKVIDAAGDFIGMQSENSNAVLAYLQILNRNNTAFSSLYFGSVGNLMINASGWVPPPTFDLRTRPWYLKAIENNRLIITAAFVNASKDDLIVTIAKPVTDRNGVVRGVIGGDVSVRTVISLVKNKKVGDTGFSFLVDGNEKMLAHPELSLDLRNLAPALPEEYQFLAKQAAQNVSGVFRHTIKGKDGYVAYQRIENTEWILGSFVSIEDFIRTEEQMGRGFLLALVVSLVILSVVFSLLARFVISPLVSLNKHVGQIDIEKSPQYRIPVCGNDEFAMVGRTINEILDKANSYLDQIIADEAEIRIREAKLQNLIKGTNVGTWEWNVQTGETVFNERWAEIIGYSLEELKPISIETWIRLTHPEDQKKSSALLQEHFQGKSSIYSCDSRMRHKDGSWVWIYDCGKVTEWDEQGNPLKMFGTHTDINYRKKLEEDLQRLAITDALTGLYNRGYFIKRSEEELRRVSRYGGACSLLMLDVDHFKQVNDNFGHLVGDEALRKIASVCEQIMRASDLLGRIGGEEFAILLFESDLTAAMQVAERLREKIENAGFITATGAAVTLRVSVGVAEFLAASETLSELMNRADKAMYQAKALGRNRVVAAE